MISDDGLATASVIIDDVEIESCRQTNLLRLVIDSRLNFPSHIEKLCNKLSICILILRSLTFFANREILFSVCYGCFLPHLICGVSIWGDETAKNRELSRLQKTASRFISGMKKSESRRGVSDLIIF